MKKLSLIIAMLLAGCGGGGGGSGVNMPPAPTATQVDEFFALVGTVVSANPEDADAHDVDSVTPTSPDASDPETM
jgi:hypothetical protein